MKLQCLFCNVPLASGTCLPEILLWKFASCLQSFTGIASESSSLDVVFSIPNINTHKLKLFAMNLNMLLITAF